MVGLGCLPLCPRDHPHLQDKRTSAGREDTRTSILLVPWPRLLPDSPARGYVSALEQGQETRPGV